MNKQLQVTREIDHLSYPVNTATVFKSEIGKSKKIKICCAGNMPPASSWGEKTCPCPFRSREKVPPAPWWWKKVPPSPSWRWEKVSPAILLVEKSDPCLFWRWGKCSLTPLWWGKGHTAALVVRKSANCPVLKIGISIPCHRSGGEKCPLFLLALVD